MGPIEQTAERAGKFLDLYRQMEDALEDKYRNTRKRYTSVVMEFTNDEESAPVREKLNICREIRNLLSHCANLGGQPVAQPSEPVLEAMEEVLDFVKRPPLAIEYATKGDQVMRANLDQKVLRLMEIMDKNGYSHIPVMKNGSFQGVFSVGSVFQYQLKSGGKGLSPNTRLQDLEPYLQLKEHRENYQFLPKDATYLTARQKFEKVQGKNKRVSVIFITETGRPGERLLGMLTPWDVLGEPE